MARFHSRAWLVASLALLLVPGAQAGRDTHERTYPPHMVAVAADASSFYLEFRARNETGGFGHSYITFGTIDGNGQLRETSIVGFMPRSADDDYWSKFALPVAGIVGVTRSDRVRRPDVRFRIALSKADYFLVVNKVRTLSKTWTDYELVMQNCNNFVGEIARSLNLRTPLITTQYPVGYVAELQALNLPLASKRLTKAHF